MLTKDALTGLSGSFKRGGDEGENSTCWRRSRRSWEWIIWQGQILHTHIYTHTHLNKKYFNKKWVVLFHMYIVTTLYLPSKHSSYPQHFPGHLQLRVTPWKRQLCKQPCDERWHLSQKQNKTKQESHLPSQGWPGTHYEAQGSLEVLVILLPLAYKLLRLQKWATEKKGSESQLLIEKEDTHDWDIILCLDSKSIEQKESVWVCGGSFLKEWKITARSPNIFVYMGCLKFAIKYYTWLKTRSQVKVC